jgi:hypothetical protein
MPSEIAVNSAPSTAISCPMCRASKGSAGPKPDSVTPADKNTAQASATVRRVVALEIFVCSIVYKYS